jgi:CheY-like chemotaxis protein
MQTTYSLIITDDDADDRFLCQQAFSDIGSAENLLLLSSGNDLLHYLDKLDGPSYPKLIVLDYNMPVINGEQTLLQLREHSKYEPIKIAFYSSGMTSQLQQRLYKLGAYKCYYKPSSLKELRSFAIELKDLVVPGEKRLATSE